MTLEDHMRIYRNLKALRKVSHYTQAELAAKIGLCRASYSQLERGLREPDLDTLCSLCQIYHITLDMLVKCDIPTVLSDYFLYETASPESHHLLKIYSQLSFTSRGRLMERAEELYQLDTCKRKSRRQE